MQKAIGGQRNNENRETERLYWVPKKTTLTIIRAGMI
jgi:hypothetical protein